jgi:hypothetical protein
MRRFLSKESFVSNTETPSAVERYTAAISGVLLLVATSLFGWGVRLALAGIQSSAGWPPGMGQLLLPVALTSVGVGFGAWRVLLMGLPARIAGLSLGWAVAACFVLAAVVGAVG